MALDEIKTVAERIEVDSVKLIRLVSRVTGNGRGLQGCDDRAIHAASAFMDEADGVASAIDALGSTMRRYERVLTP